MVGTIGRTDSYMQELKENTEYTGIHPQKFALWVAMASMTMFFAGLTSAVILRRGDFQAWENFRLPGIFMVSTAIIIAVSVSMHASLLMYRKANFKAFRWLLFSGLVLAVAFLLTQIQGWRVLTQMGKPINGNISGQFLYLIPGMHGLHIVVALLVTLMVLIFAVRARKDELYELRNIINPKRQLHMELLVTFWHYIDIVWVYLYIFFYLNYR
ncbi:MAG: cytochrome c oxidase subunit 3 [Chitinophagales bacterium]